MAASREWTTVEQTYLTQNYGKMPAATIATQLARSYHAILVKAYKLKLNGTRQKWKHIDKLPELREMIEFGYTQRAIGKKLDIPESSIVHLIKKHCDHNTRRFALQNIRNHRK